MPPSLLTPLADLELVHDNVGPLPPVAMLESITNSDIVDKMREGNPEQMHDDVRPLPPVAMMETITDSAMMGNKTKGDLE